MMDSWKYLSEGKGGWLSEELESPFDNHGNCKNKVMGCEIKPFFNVENYPLVSNAQALDRLDLMELGFSDEIRKSSYSLSSEPSGEVFSNEIGTDSYKNVISPFGDEKDLGSRISTENVQSKNHELPLIDLKLGNLGDNGGAIAEFSKTSVHLPSSVSSLPMKRTRSTSLHPRIPCCQVLGCNKDLSSYKGYYKRHKVCDVHTKTAKVILQGIEQRFCQQCSRFHLLAEFDDGKRSCRRRLAAHNKRRRKPPVTSKSGTTIIGFSSFAFQDMLSSTHAASSEGMGNVLNHQRFSTPNQTTSALSLLSAHQPHINHISTPLLETTTTTTNLLISNHHSQRTQPTSELLPHETTMHLVANITNHSKDNFTDSSITNPYLRNINNLNHHNNKPLGRGIVLDLLQLSSRLQRVEQQRHSTESEAG